MRPPLEGIATLDVGTLTPGKYCTFLLADLGASVLRIERPVRRPVPISSEDLLLNRAKRSMTLNLREDAGREVLYRLVETADVLIESYRPGVAERIGIDYQRLKERNERLVYCSLSGFGQQGPYRLRPAYDLTFLGMSGVLQALVGEGAPPLPPGTYLSDAVSGLMAALAISAALLARQSDGEGRYLDLAMLDSIFSLLSVSHGLRPASDSSALGAPETPSSALYAVYETGDGRYVTLAAIQPTSCRALFEELGRPELADDAWSSGERGAQVSEFLSRTFKAASAAEWIERLAKLDVEIGPVRTPAEAFDDPQLTFRRMVIETTHPEAGPLEQIGSPLHTLRDAPESTQAVAPAVGADTDEVLRELGYDRTRISRLREAGIV
jgi:crotonobetainyl-CoA:carnitine CoA-transferase CaiB-like acyl-CoA transferase